MAASRGLCLLLAPLCRQASHLLIERLGVLLRGLGADVAARSEDVAVLTNLVERDGLAEAGDVRIFAGLLLARRGRCS